MAGYDFYKEKQKLITEIMNDDTHGRKIYLLGSAEYGPVNEPKLIRSTVGLYNKFGKNGTLVEAFHKIKYTNRNNNIYLVKTTGEHAVTYFNVNIFGGEIIRDGFVLTSSEANDIFNYTLITLYEDKIKIQFHESIDVSPLTYNFNDYRTIDELSRAINKDTRNNKSFIYAHYSVDPDTPVENAFYNCNEDIKYMYGGESGLGYSKNLLYNCLERTYEMLESETIDIIIPLDAFMDDIYPDDSDNVEYRYNKRYYHTTKDYLTEDISGIKLSYMDQLINFCIKQLNFGIVTNGIIGFNSNYHVWSRYLSESDYITEMYNACMEYNLAQCMNPFYSFMVSVVTGDIEYNKGTYTDNGYLAYAALCANTVITEGTTNIPVSDSISIWHELSEDKLKILSENGMVAFRHSPFYNQPVVYSGVTAHTENENLALYCNIRMIQMTISYINRLFQFYIGENIEKLIREQIVVNDLDSVLGRLSEANILTNYDFRIVPLYAEGHIKVYLNLLTNYMVKPIQLCAEIETSFKEEE